MAWPDLRGRHHEAHTDTNEAPGDGPAKMPSRRRTDSPTEELTNVGRDEFGRDEPVDESDVETGVGGDRGVSASVGDVDDDDAPLATVIDLWADPDAGRYLHFPVSPDAPDEPLDWVFGPRPRHLTLVPGPATLAVDVDHDTLAEPTPATGILALVPPELVLFMPGTGPRLLDAAPVEHELASIDVAVAEPQPAEPLALPRAADVTVAANVAFAPPPDDRSLPLVALPIELFPLTSALPIATSEARDGDIATDAGPTPIDMLTTATRDATDDEADEHGDEQHVGTTSERRGALRPARMLLVAATWLAYVIVAGAAWMLIWATIPRAFGWQPIVITGGSMEPAIERGVIILARPVPTSALVPGAVITFTDPNRAGQLITHRIVSIKPDGSLETRGDHNGTPDPQSVAVRTVRGRAVLRLPYLGRPVVWIQQQNWPPLAGSVFVLVASLALVSRSRRRADDDVDDVDDERDDGSVDSIDNDDDDEDASNPPPEPLAARPLPPPAVTGHGWRPPLLARPGGQPRAARRRGGRRPTLIISRRIEPST